MTAVMTEIISLLTAGLTQMATGISGGLNTMVTELFIETTGSGSEAVTHLSTFGSIVVIFAGIALAVGLTRLVVKWVTSLGGKRM